MHTNFEDEERFFSVKNINKQNNYNKTFPPYTQSFRMFAGCAK